MVDKETLHKARKELLDAGASLVFFGETYISIDWFKAKSPNTLKDTELAFLKEALSIWKTEVYNANNLKGIIGDHEGDLEGELKHLLSIKTQGKDASIAVDNFTKFTRGTEVIKQLEQEAQEIEKDLDQANKDKEKLQTDLTHSKERYGKLVDYWGDKFLNEFDFKILSVNSLGLVREKLDQLKTDKEKVQKDYDELLTKVDKVTPETQLENEYIEIKVPLILKEVPSKLWDRTEVGNDWDKEYIESTNTVKVTESLTGSGAKEVPMMESDYEEKGHLWDRRFRNQTDLDNFRKYITDSAKEKVIKMAWAFNQKGGEKTIKDITTDIWLYIPKPDELTQLLRDANKLFIKDGYGKTTSKEAFEFLKSIIGSREITATIRLTGRNVEELQKQIQTLQDQIQQEKTKASGLEIELEGQQNTVYKLNENINVLDEENQDLKKEVEVLKKQLEQVKASSSLVVREGEELDWIKFLTLKDSIHHVDLDLRVYLKEKEKIQQKEVYWDEVFDKTEKEMKFQACSWLTDIVEGVNKEVNDYGGKAEREKKSTFHPRAHYFIFYKDGSKEHWLALLPPVRDGQEVTELGEGHKHKAFILEFDKPVEKFVDIYTCLGCGGSDQFSDLHPDYGYGSHQFGNAMPTDSWNDIRKVSDFDLWYEELNNPETKPYIYTEEGKEKTAMRLYTKRGKCLGSDFDVWPGATIKDSKDKSFDKAYGFINKEGKLEWKLERTAQGIKENEEWALKEVSERINSLWENKDFTSWKDKSPCQQRAMYSFIQDCLENEQDKHELALEYSGGKRTLKVDLKKIGDNFKELISAKKFSYKFLEKWIQKILSGDDIRQEIKEDEEFIALKSKPLVIREIWSQQVERFIQEKKAKKFYLEHHQEGLTWEDHARIKIDWLYEEVRDKLELENQVFEAHVEVAAK